MDRSLWIPITILRACPLISSRSHRFTTSPDKTRKNFRCEGFVSFFGEITSGHTRAVTTSKIEVVTAFNLTLPPKNLEKSFAGSETRRNFFRNETSASVGHKLDAKSTSRSTSRLGRFRSEKLRVRNGFRPVDSRHASERLAFRTNFSDDEGGSNGLRSCSSSRGSWASTVCLE